MVDFRPTASASSGRMPIPQRGVAGREIARGGAALGEALFGAAMQDRQLDERQRQVDHELQMAELQRARQAEIADAAGRFAELKGGLAIYGEELKVAPGAKPGAAGHAATFATEADRRLKEFADTLSADPEVRSRFQPMIQAAFTEMTTREQAWEIGERGKYQGDQWKKYADGKTIEVQGAPLDKLLAAIDESTSLAEGMGFTGNVRAAVLDATHRGMAVSWIDSRVAAGQQAEVREILQQGLLDPFLTADLKTRFLDAADRADAQAAHEAEAAASRQRDAARETVKAVQSLLDAGAEPTTAEMNSLYAAAKSLPPDEQIDVAAIGVQRDVNRATRGQTPTQIRRERDRLAAKVEAGTASRAEQMMLKAYGVRLDSAEDAESERISGLLGGGGAQGQLAAIEATNGLDRESRVSVLEKASPGLGHVALLPTATSRQMAVQGAEIRKAQPDLVDAKEAREAFRQNVGRIGGELGAGYDDKLAVAMNMYAVHVSRAPQDGFNKNLFWQYTNIAFGATKRGDGKWQGGLGTVNERRVVLPDHVTQGELVTAIARTDWSKAQDHRGRPVGKAFITGSMWPELIEETPTYSKYRMTDAAGNMLTTDGTTPLYLRVANGR